MSSAWLSRPMTAVPAPSETPAVISGRNIATNEPKARNSTIAAAMKPMNSDESEFCLLPASAMLPSTLKWTGPDDADVITLSKCVASEAVILFWLAALSNTTSANATVPPDAICLAVCAV